MWSLIVHVLASAYLDAAVDIADHHGRALVGLGTDPHRERAANNQPRSRPARQRPVTDESAPNKTWHYDFLTFPTKAGDYHCVPVLYGCSRKITGRYFGPELPSSAVHAAWDKALAPDGLLGEDAPRGPDGGV